MATNKYFTNYNSKYEQTLIEDLVVETIKIHGLDIYYLPRELNSQIDLFGDDPTSSFRQHFVIEMFLETVDGFEGSGDMIGRFGLEIRDSATFIVSKKRFGEVIESLPRPKEGDLLYFPLAKKFFEIKHVEHENPFYQLGKNYVYSLNVELLIYSEEDINTQLELDDEIRKYDFNVILTYETIQGSSFNVGETVYTFSDGSTSGSFESSTGRGTISSIDTSNKTIEIENVYGDWLESTNDKNYYAITQNNTYAKIINKTTSTDESSSNINKIIDDIENNYLDFSEENPFGDVF